MAKNNSLFSVKEQRVETQMDRFEDLQTFVTVAVRRSVRQSAELLGRAPSAVSRRIKELETRLRTQLLIRTTLQIRLTGAGERFLVQAKRILSELQEASLVEAVYGGEEGVEGLINVSRQAASEGGQIIQLPVTLVLKACRCTLVVTTTKRFAVRSPSMTTSGTRPHGKVG